MTATDKSVERRVITWLASQSRVLSRAFCLSDWVQLARFLARKKNLAWFAQSLKESEEGGAIIFLSVMIFATPAFLALAALQAVAVRVLPQGQSIKGKIRQGIEDTYWFVSLVPKALAGGVHLILSAAKNKAGETPRFRD